MDLQLIDNHHIVSESNYTGNAVKLPSADQIPNIDLEVMSKFVQAAWTQLKLAQIIISQLSERQSCLSAIPFKAQWCLFNSFHSKFLVVDGRVALISSNNIQDRVNLEMMTHLEGNIVKSFTDTALLSWHE